MTNYPAELPGHSADRQPRTRSAQQILVVEDEAVVREFLTRCLERAGYTVKQAGNAGEAIELMNAEPADLVLCDIRMPGQDGLWLTGRLRARWPETPVVMTTAIDNAETVRQSRELGAVDYINKPVKPDQLIQVVRRVLASEKEEKTPMHEEARAGELAHQSETKIEAEYTLETPVRCPACGERISSLKAVRLIRATVNFTSTLPRRGRLTACPICLAVIPAELTNF